MSYIKTSITQKPEPPSDLWEAMDRIRAEDPKLSNDDPGFTIEEYCSKYGLERSSANNQLNDLARKGKLKAGWRLRNGRKFRVFQPI